MEGERKGRGSFPMSGIGEGSLLLFPGLAMTQPVPSLCVPPCRQHFRGQ